MTTVESPLVDRATFRGALSRFASGVTIVTSRDATGRDHGMTVSAFSSLSLTPPLVLVCIDHKATWHAMIDQSTHYVVHVLASDHQHHHPSQVTYGDGSPVAHTPIELRFTE